jgi:hypothetical protein
VPASYIDAPATSPGFDVLTWPMTVAKVLKCGVEMLEVLREDLFRGAYILSVILPQQEMVPTSNLVSC